MLILIASVFVISLLITIIVRLTDNNDEAMTDDDMKKRFDEFIKREKFRRNIE